MKLTTQEIEQVAKLARLELNDAEKEMYAEQLSVVFEYIEKLNEVNTDGVTETCQVTGLEDVIREDQAKEKDKETIQKLIENFPDKVGRLLRVKAVFNNTEEEI